MKNGEIIFEALEHISDTEAQDTFHLGLAEVKAAHGITMTEPEEEYLIRFYGRNKSKINRKFNELRNALGGREKFVEMCEAIWAEEGDQYK